MCYEGTCLNRKQTEDFVSQNLPHVSGYYKPKELAEIGSKITGEKISQTTVKNFRDKPELIKRANSSTLVKIFCGVAKAKKQQETKPRPPLPPEKIIVKNSTLNEFKNLSKENQRRALELLRAVTKN